MQKIILTGDRPTGRLHVGHYVGSLRRRVELQNSGEFDKIFIMIADAQALTDNFDNPEKVRQNIIEVALDYLSAGLDPAKTNILIQSQIAELTELTFYYMNLVTVSRLQLPMLEQCREIVHKFNTIYDEVLVEPEALLPDNEACMRLPGTDGKAKMSKSLGNCIYLSETTDEVRKKIMSMYTDPLHLQVSDPGHLEGNTVFTYLDAFCKPEHFGLFLPEYADLDELKAHYQRGGLGDVKVKKFLNNILQAELEPIRARRKEYEKDIAGVYDILKAGTEKAREAAAETLSDVKKAMRIDYFEDMNLIAEQSERFRNKSE